MTAKLTNWGATLVSLLVPDKKGKELDVVLGFDKLKDYFVNHCYFGATIGRNGNRIGGAEFTINGKKYQLDKNERDKNDLHSGFNGYQKRLWEATKNEDRNAVTFKILSPDLDQGFPGNFNVSVTYTLSDDNGLEIEYNGISDKDTIANMTNHSYFHLNVHNSGSITDHFVQINSNNFAVVDNESIPTGELHTVKNTPLDFTNFRKISDDIDSDFELNEYGMPRRFSDGLYHIKENPVETTKFFTMNYLRDDISKVLKDRELQIKATGVQTQFKLAI